MALNYLMYFIKCLQISSCTLALCVLGGRYCKWYENNLIENTLVFGKGLPFDMICCAFISPDDFFMYQIFKVV